MVLFVAGSLQWRGLSSEGLGLAGSSGVCRSIEKMRKSKESLGNRLIASLLLAIIWLHGKLTRPERLPNIKEGKW